MDRYQTLTIYALLIILTGIILIILSYNPLRVIQYAVAVAMFASAIFSFLTAFKSKNLQINLKYHELHGAGMIIYGLAILFYATTLQIFLNITAFFLLYYGMSEIIFCFQLLIMKQRNISAQVVAFRLIIGFFIAMGAVLSLATATINQNVALLSAGAVFVFSGVYLIVFKTVLKKADKIVTPT